MDRIIQLNRSQANEFFETLSAIKESSRTGLTGLRIAIDDGQEDTVKFKVNDYGWSPPTGALDPACRKAARKRVDQVEKESDSYGQSQRHR